MIVISLRQAKDQGLTRYFTGAPCKHGHVAERLVSTRGCLVCGNERLQAYKEKNREAFLEKKRSTQARYVAENPEKIMAIRRATMSKHRIARNAEKAAWRRRNKAKVLALTRKRQLAKIQRTPKWLTDDDLWMMTQAYELASSRTAMFGFQWHVDHVLPLQGKSVSGLHVPLNLQVIPGCENSRKGNRLEADHG
jgi:hypothetical protein